MDDIPITRVTRLKEPEGMFWRDDGMKTNIGVTLGSISGMAPSQTLRRGTKTDVAVGIHNTSPRSKHIEESKAVFQFKCLLI